MKSWKKSPIDPRKCKHDIIQRYQVFPNKPTWWCETCKKSLSERQVMDLGIDPGCMLGLKKEKKGMKKIWEWLAVIGIGMGTALVVLIGMIGAFLLVVLSIALRALPFILVIGVGFWIARYFGVI